MAEPLRVRSFLFCLGFLWLEAFNLCDGDLWSAVRDSWWPSVPPFILLGGPQDPEAEV